MSEIRVTTVSDTAGTGPVSLTKQTAAKTIARFQDGGSPNSESLNASSVTDRAVGKYTLSYTNSYNAATYITVGVAFDGSGENDTRSLNNSDDATYSTSEIQLHAGYHDASQNGNVILDDITKCMVVSFGDLA